MSILTNSAARRWEVHHPLVLSAAAFAGVMWLGDDLYRYATAEKWHLDQAYTTVFTLATVFTAFLFTFYTFIVTADRGFLEAARTSSYFQQTVTYTLRAIVIGSVLCLFTIPMLVVQPAPTTGDPWLIIAAMWAGLTVWAAASFVRAAYLFSIFVANQR